jgi:glycosyl transferase, family 25
MRIILINLARATERLQKMQQQFSALGLDFSRLEARDGKSLAAEDCALVDDARRRRITPYPLSDNEIGCWLSHRHALQDVANGSDAMAAIVEDDAQFTENFPAVLKAIENALPAFDFIFLHRKMKRREIFVPTRQLLPGISMGRVGPAHMGAISYVVSKKGAQKFLDYAPRFAHAVDKEIHRYWANGLDIYGLECAVVTHCDGGKSFIEETREQERSHLRPRYPNADSLYWRAMRFKTRMEDSFYKRAAWREYVQKEKL